MALSADEQRALAEIERRLATDDPGLATCMTAFRRPGPSRILRSPRARIIGSLFTVLLVAMVSLMVYAMIPFRGNNVRPSSSQTTAGTPGSVSTSSTGTGGQQGNSPLASASTGPSATVAASSAPPSAGATTGSGQAASAGSQAADPVASSATGP